VTKEEFAEGDRVRATRNIEVGTIKIRRTSWGTIRQIDKRLFSANYTVVWETGKAELKHHGTKDFVLAQVSDGGVYKG
jgi:hypothetical protein